MGEHRLSQRIDVFQCEEFGVGRAIVKEERKEEARGRSWQQVWQREMDRMDRVQMSVGTHQVQGAKLGQSEGEVWLRDFVTPCYRTGDIKGGG